MTGGMGYLWSLSRRRGRVMTPSSWPDITPLGMQDHRTIPIMKHKYLAPHFLKIVPTSFYAPLKERPHVLELDLCCFNCV